jgi:hypothetical protein
VAGAVLVAFYSFAARLIFGNKLYGIWNVPTIAPFGPFVSKNHCRLRRGDGALAVIGHRAR